MKRSVGIDFGLKRIGIAISDSMQVIASPFQTVQAEKTTDQTVQKILHLLESDAKERGYTIETIVIGMPYQLNGKKGFMADEVSHFMEAMTKQTAIPLTTWDERLTSAQAERSLKEAKMNRKKRAQVVDRVSAVIILQNYLDQRGMRGG